LRSIKAEDGAVGKLDDIVSLCKRKGFVYQSSEIYSPMAGFYDYGPLGVEMKNNIKKLWWRDMVQRREDIVGLDSSIIASPAIWNASGQLPACSACIAF
jgi:glycyl-tRNA synthetase